MEPAARSGIPALRGLLFGCALSLTLWAAIIAGIRLIFGWRP
jgi:hypothetical protein